MSPNSKDKGLLRESWKAQYPNFQSFFASWSKEICWHISTHPVFLKAERIGIFFPREWEVNLLPLWQQRPQVCGFPKTDPSSWEMSFYLVDSLSEKDMAPGYGGIREPNQHHANKLDNFHSHDLILVPGFAFDERGGRVGSGRGVYDRFLAKEGKLAHKWGVAFSPQVHSGEFTLESHDIPLDGLVTEKGFIYF